MADHYAMQKICCNANHQKTIVATRIVEDEASRYKSLQHMKKANATTKTMEDEAARQEHPVAKCKAINKDSSKISLFKDFLEILGKIR